jgi:capsule polysaccharide export protein KpsE/RkpR
VESRRQNVAVHEIEPITEVEFPAPQGTTASPEPQAQDLLVILQLLWEARRQLGRVVAWALAISTLIAFLIPNQYESSVRVMPPDSTSSAGGMLATALAGKGNANSNSELAMMAGSLLGMKAPGALYVNLFRSRTVQDRIIDRLSLQNVYGKRYKEDARKKLDGRTDVTEDRKSGVITLEVEDHNPHRAHDIAQAYVEELNRVLALVSTSSARRERIFIEQRLVTVKSDLEDAEKQFSAFASKNTTLDIREQTKAMVESAAILQGQLIAAESELQSLEQIYTDSNVRVRALRARIGELKQQLLNMQGSDASLMSDTTQSDELYPSIRKLPLLGVQWADLYRRMKIQETVYELLNQQYEMARIQEAKEIPTVNAVDLANVPEKKSFPPRAIIILGLTLVSLVGASLWTVASHNWRLIDPDDPRKLFTESVCRETSHHLRSWAAPVLHLLKAERASEGNEESSVD